MDEQVIQALNEWERGTLDLEAVQRHIGGSTMVKEAMGLVEMCQGTAATTNAQLKKKVYEAS